MKTKYAIIQKDFLKAGVTGYLEGFGATRHGCGPYFTTLASLALLYDDIESAEEDLKLALSGIKSAEIIEIKVD